MDVHAEHKGKLIQSLYSIKNLPTAVMVFGSGSAQYYAPQVKAAWLFSFDLGELKLRPGISSAISFAEDLDYYMFHLGSFLALDIQPVVHIAYKDLVSLGLSYRYGDGFHAGMGDHVEKS